MLSTIEQYYKEAMTSREEAYNLAVVFAKAIGSDVKPRRKVISRDKHSEVLSELGLKGKKYFSERAAVVAAIGCLSEGPRNYAAYALNAFLTTHRAKLQLVEWNCISHDLPSKSNYEAMSIQGLKQWINRKTKGDRGVRAASLEALYKALHPSLDPLATMGKAANVQFCDIAILSVNENLSAHAAFLQILSSAETSAYPAALMQALALLMVPSETLKLERGQAIAIVRKARNKILINDSEDRATESDKESAKVRQQAVNNAFDTIENHLFPEKSKVSA